MAALVAERGHGGITVRIMLAFAILLVTGGVSPVSARQFESTTLSCTVTEVAVFSDRVHVRCQEAAILHFPGRSSYSIFYFSAESSDPIASRLVTVGATAAKSGSPISITFDPNAQTSPAGCLAFDCRRVTAFAIYP